jgi:transcriptional regulator with XRE-family HTH domain/plasmid maintenance system antidote protein VapI
MRDNRESLKRAVDLINETRAAEGRTVTEEEMAGKINLSPEQFRAYLNGEEETPDALSFRLKTAFGIQTVSVESVQSVQVRSQQPPKNEAERRERNRSSVRATIHLIKSIGEDMGQTITQDAIAGKINLSPGRLEAYLNGEEPAPVELTGLLHSAYSDLIKSHRSVSNRNLLERTLVKIRNRGLAAGRDITLEEMAEKADLSMEQLYAYLAGEQETPDDMESSLRSAYKDLFENTDTTVIKEMIFLDKKARRVNLI